MGVGKEDLLEVAVRVGSGPGEPRHQLAHLLHEILGGGAMLEKLPSSYRCRGRFESCQGIILLLKATWRKKNHSRLKYSH